ncbi:hypothetical protein NLG97_g7742 [Lecanicillium saksenae]|uniref:Uncharacterized protein n=1 Tax=Lecanicillium saksenae TaxID=468837 RepID=A0ACC1QLG9_9HYPO|nr:hypothetical protein NLG97_g7742 [Lecanicillium saksenae]
MPPSLATGHCFVGKEPETSFILNTWSREVVQRGMNSVKEHLPTCTWNPTIREATSEGTGILATASTSYASTPGRRTGPSPANSPSFESALRYKLAAARRERKKKHLVPDAGATMTCRTHDDMCSESSLERLPKDYKPATKWRSSDALEQILEKGKGGYLKKGGARKGLAWPIRQAYTYCVELGCRYGCILTTEEAFLFRIRPACVWLYLEASADQKKYLKTALQTHGLMEYASFPWTEKDSGSSSKNEATENKPTLTFNLAVWFIHVLAACQSHLDWSYNPLTSENIDIHECKASKDPITPQSEGRHKRTYQGAWPRSRSRSRKRAREDVTESYTHSFTSDGFGLTDSFQQSFRSESAPTDSTCVEETPRWVPRSDAVVSPTQIDGEALRANEYKDNNAELRKSKRVRARVERS